MSVKEHSGKIDAPADEVFQYLSDVRNLPHYFPEMTHAEPEGRDRRHDATAVDVEGDVGGTRHESHGWFKVDPDHRRIEWGSQDTEDYHGWMTVEEQGKASSLTLNLTGPHIDDEGALRDSVDRVRDALRHDAER
jgi:uncharacterized protein YndB with AHSA1/START domain